MNLKYVIESICTFNRTHSHQKINPFKVLHFSDYQIYHHVSLILQNIINYLKLTLTRYVYMFDHSNTTFYEAIKST